MPLIKGFKSTTIFRAFVLNALASSLIIVVAMNIKDYFDRFDLKGEINSNVNSYKSILYTFIFTFASTLIAYTIMYYLFGYGGGLLADC